MPAIEPKSTFQIDAILRSIARHQLGLVTVTQAIDMGVDRRALDRRRDSGALVTVFAGVLRLSGIDASPHQCVLAAGLAVPRSVISASCAGVVHQMPVGSGAITPIVAVDPDRSARTAGITVIRQSIALPSRPWHTTRVATPAATLLLLPRFLDDAVVERCLDHCLVNRLITVPAMQRLIDQLPPRALVGRRLLIELLAQRSAGMGHRSRLEQRVARWLRAGGLDGWERNFDAPVGGGRTVEVDFAWPVQKVVLEVSPFYTHGSRAAQERDVQRRRSLVKAGWIVVEATDPDLVDQHAFRPTLDILRLHVRCVPLGESQRTRRLEEGGLGVAVGGG
ncbi:MAG: type IV toxin-antitoxin system AbiEi family antitoxin domain-containing protein [Actinomycetota bacterium]|nr:type IV toxin-antitoxin system AbiEi family antitoxin domain-containing protein [Actinomycetota bacterium]